MNVNTVNLIKNLQNNVAELQNDITQLALELGFDAVGFSDVDLAQHEAHLNRWLENDFHGEMDYMAKHGTKRSRPPELVDNTCSVISVRMDYLPEQQSDAESILNNSEKAFISRYAMGRDYHKVMRNRLQKLVIKITKKIGPFGYRVFTDSAPVLEKALAEKSGLGWIGKHSNVIHNKAGSWFFIGEIFTDLPLIPCEKSGNHCGSCRKCIDICPTKAIVAPYQVDARRCISYLTIELKGSIPTTFRKDIGNRIYGCDDCQLVCPWNKFAQLTREIDFLPRHQLDNKTLLELFSWNEELFLSKMEGSAIRRIGYERWQRNIAVALGNNRAVDQKDRIISALREKRLVSSKMVKEHIDWAIEQLLDTD